MESDVCEAEVGLKSLGEGPFSFGGSRVSSPPEPSLAVLPTGNPPRPVTFKPLAPGG